MGFDPAKLQAFLAKGGAGAKTGGKGSVRRKQKVVRKNTAQDSKKMKAILNKLNVREIPAIEEVNFFKADNQITHFKAPKVQASIAANTYVVTGTPQEKKLEDLLPGIISQLGADNLESLQKIYKAFAEKDGKTGDDDVPDLVEDFEQVSKDETTIVVPPEVTPQGDSQYITYDDDVTFGQEFPSLDSLEYVTGPELPRPKAGSPFLVVTWAQFHKPGFPYLKMYSELSTKFGSKLPFLAVSLDPEIASPQKYLKDPAGKYNKVFPLTFSVAWDNGLKLKAALAKILRKPMSLPHTFLVDGSGKIVWRQDHSMIGSMAVPHMDIVESQAARLATGVPLQSTGNAPAGDDEPDVEEAAGGNVGALAEFLDGGDDEDGDNGGSNY
jgi:nascent polypeptide-associated complex subunit beta